MFNLFFLTITIWLLYEVMQLNPRRATNPLAAFIDSMAWKGIFHEKPPNFVFIPS